MIHLHTQSAFSLLQSPIRIEQLVKKAKMEQKKYVALTDRNVLFGVPAFLRACKQYDIAPIVGLEVEASVGETEKIGFVILAKNNEGLASLYQISALASRKEPTLDELAALQAGCALIA